MDSIEEVGDHEKGSYSGSSWTDTLQVPHPTFFFSLYPVPTPQHHPLTIPTLKSYHFHHHTSFSGPDPPVFLL